MLESKEKEVRYEITNTYSTLYGPGNGHKQIWFVCHGLGHLSRYFIRYFDKLESSKHYIIAPQAASKYYLNSEFNRVGGSWLTKERTAEEIENVLTYYDQIRELELIQDRKLVVIGFSQGVSVAVRWVVRRKIPCQKLIMYAGRAPHELQPKDLQHLLDSNTQIYYVHGSEDPYITDELIRDEKIRMDKLFSNKVEYISFDGGHHIDSSVLLKISQS